MSNFVADTILENGVDFDSDAVDVIAYNTATSQLFVKFLGGAFGYAYNGVSRSTFDLFAHAPSKGRFYSAFAKSNRAYSCPYNAVLNVEKTAASSSKAEPQKVNVKAADAGLSKYTVQWQTQNGRIGGNPEFQAKSEEDALSQFNNAIEAAALIDNLYKNVKVTAVTHYF